MVVVGTVAAVGAGVKAFVGTGVAEDSGVAVGVGTDVTVDSGVTVGVGIGVAVGAGVTVGVGIGVAVGFGVAVDSGDGVKASARPVVAVGSGVAVTVESGALAGCEHAAVAILKKQISAKRIRLDKKYLCLFIKEISVSFVLVIYIVYHVNRKHNKVEYDDFDRDWKI